MPRLAPEIALLRRRRDELEQRIQDSGPASRSWQDALDALTALDAAMAMPAGTAQVRAAGRALTALRTALAAGRQHDGLYAELYTVLALIGRLSGRESRDKAAAMQEAQERALADVRRARAQRETRAR